MLQVSDLAPLSTVYPKRWYLPQVLSVVASLTLHHIYTTDRNWKGQNTWWGISSYERSGGASERTGGEIILSALCMLKMPRVEPQYPTRMIEMTFSLRELLAILTDTTSSASDNKLRTDLDLTSISETTCHTSRFSPFHWCVWYSIFFLFSVLTVFLITISIRNDE